MTELSFKGKENRVPVPSFLSGVNLLLNCHGFVGSDKFLEVFCSLQIFVKKRILGWVFMKVVGLCYFSFVS